MINKLKKLFIGKKNEMAWSIFYINVKADFFERNQKLTNL